MTLDERVSGTPNRPRRHGWRLAIDSKVLREIGHRERAALIRENSLPVIGAEVRSVPESRFSRRGCERF